MRPLAQQAIDDARGLLLEVVRAFDLDYLLEASRALHCDEGTQPPPDLALRVALHRRLQDGAQAVCFRRKAGDAPIAFAVYAWRGRHARIEQFRVEPAARRAGWGQRCIRALLEGPLATAERVDVRVLEDNRVARIFWTKLGFGTERLGLKVYPRPVGAPYP